MKTIYVVVMKHTFDAEVVVYDCGENYEKAKEKLNELWEEYINEEYANSSELTEEECYHEDEYARVTWSDGDYTDFTLTYLR